MLGKNSPPQRGVVGSIGLGCTLVLAASQQLELELELAARLWGLQWPLCLCRVPGTEGLSRPHPRG